MNLSRFERKTIYIDQNGKQMTLSASAMSEADLDYAIYLLTNEYFISLQESTKENESQS